MPRRIGRPGLVGTMARTAVITGTAQAVAGRTAHRQQTRWANEAAEAQQQAAAPAPAPAPAAAPAAPVPASAGNDLMAQLQQLAELKAAGILSDDEFAAAKAKLLAP